MTHCPRPKKLRRQPIVPLTIAILALYLTRSPGLAQVQPSVGSTPTPPPAFTFSTVTPRAILIPANTAVFVNLDAPLSSQTTKVGATFSFTVDQDGVVNRALGIPKGAKGQGHDQGVEAAAYHVFARKPGVLTLAVDWVTAIDGEKVVLAGTVASRADYATQAAGYLQSDAAQYAVYSAATYSPAVASALGGVMGVPVVGPIVGAALNFVQVGRGAIASIGSQDVFVVVVQYAVHVSSDIAAKQSFGPGFAH